MIKRDHSQGNASDDRRSMPRVEFMFDDVIPSGTTNGISGLECLVNMSQHTKGGIYLSPQKYMAILPVT